MPSADVSLHTQRLRVSVGNIKTIQALPSESVSERPVIIAPGWVEIPEIFQELAVHLADVLRRPVIAFKSLRYGGHVDSRRTGAEKEQYRSANTLLAIVQETRIDTVDVVAHSAASIYATLAALEEPSFFEHLIFLGPAGFSEMSHLTLIKRAFIEIGHRAGESNDTESPARAAYETLLKAQELLINPVRSFWEAWSVAQYELGEQVQAVRSNGVHVSIIHGTVDKLIRVEEIKSYLRENQLELDGFYDLTGGEHGFPLHHPDETAEVIQKILRPTE